MLHGILEVRGTGSDGGKNSFFIDRCYLARLYQFFYLPHHKFPWLTFRMTYAILTIVSEDTTSVVFSGEPFQK